MVDESTLTGESDPKEKNVVTEENQGTGTDSILLGLTYIQEGQGWAVVVGVGKSTIAGQIMAKINVENEQTPMQVRLEDMAT